MQDLAIITSLIDQAKTAEEAEQKKAEERLQEVIKSVRAKTIEQLGEAWSALSPFMQEEVFPKDGGRRVDIDWNFLPGKAHELELAPIEISASNHGYSENKISVWNERGYSPYKFVYAQMAEALFRARSMFPEYRKQYEEEFIKARNPLLYWRTNQDEAKAHQAHSELVQGVPDRKIEWDGMLTLWIEHREANQRQEERKANQQREYDVLKEMFKADCQAYLEARKAAYEHNAKTIAPLQALLDVSFDVWQLTYAIHARDEDGESEVDQRTVWLAQPEPDAVTGEYLCVDGRKVKFYNPVSLEKQTFKPSDELSGSYRRILVQTHYLYVSAKMGQEDVDACIASAGFVPLPEEPKAPEGLEYWDVEQIKHSLKRAEPSYDF
jgi:hypothetical protein